VGVPIPAGSGRLRGVRAREKSVGEYESMVVAAGAKRRHRGRGRDTNRGGRFNVTTDLRSRVRDIRTGAVS